MLRPLSFTLLLLIILAGVLLASNLLSPPARETRDAPATDPLSTARRILQDNWDPQRDEEGRDFVIPDGPVELDDAEDLVITRDFNFSPGCLWRIERDPQSPALVRIDPERWQRLPITLEEADQLAKTFLQLRRAEWMHPNGRTESPYWGGFGSHAAQYRTVLRSRIDRSLARALDQLDIQMYGDRELPYLQRFALDWLLRQIETRLGEASFEALPVDRRSEVLERLQTSETWPEQFKRQSLEERHMETYLSGQLAVRHEIREAIPELERLHADRHALWLKARTSEDPCQFISENLPEFWPGPALNYLRRMGDALPLDSRRELLHQMIREWKHPLSQWEAVSELLTLEEWELARPALEELLSERDKPRSRLPLLRALLHLEWNTEHFEDLCRLLFSEDIMEEPEYRSKLSTTFWEVAIARPEVRDHVRVIYRDSILPHRESTSAHLLDLYLAHFAHFADARDVGFIRHQILRTGSVEYALALAVHNPELTRDLALEAIRRSNKEANALSKESAIALAEIALVVGDRRAAMLLDDPLKRSDLRPWSREYLEIVQSLLLSNDPVPSLRRLEGSSYFEGFLSLWGPLFEERLLERGVPKELLRELRQEREYVSEGTAWSQPPQLWK